MVYIYKKNRINDCFWTFVKIQNVIQINDCFGDFNDIDSIVYSDIYIRCLFPSALIILEIRCIPAVSYTPKLRS
jgi:hypothetical protein